MPNAQHQSLEAFVRQACEKAAQPRPAAGGCAPLLLAILIGIMGLIVLQGIELLAARPAWSMQTGGTASAAEGEGRIIPL